MVAVFNMTKKISQIAAGILTPDETPLILPTTVPGIAIETGIISGSRAKDQLREL